MAGANPIWTAEDDDDAAGGGKVVAGDLGNPMVTGAGAGINPLYKDDRRGYDNYSMSSGDSVLIGVEDNQDFKDYKGHKNVRRPLKYQDRIISRICRGIFKSASADP